MGKQKIWLIVLVLLVPIVPFVAFGHWLEPLIETRIDAAIAGGNLWWVAIGIVAGLTVDIFLPVPSSVLLTFAGRCFGGWGGAAIGWVGLNLSAAIGFWLSRFLGRAVLDRFSSQADVNAIEVVDNRLGGWSLVACRPLPILAEASVLFAGLYRMPGRKFWPPVIVANGVIALLYAWLGDYASQQQWFTTAVVLSMLFPLLFAIAWRSRQNGGGRTVAKKNGLLD